MKTKQNVVIGFLGTSLDQGKKEDRWTRWRPTVGICQQKNLPIHRIEIIFDERYKALYDRVKADIQTISPKTIVCPRQFAINNPWDFEEVYASLLDFARTYQFEQEREEYFIHITTGTHVAQICLFLLTESRYFPGRLIQSSPDKKQQSSGEIAIIDLDLSKYDSIAMRFKEEAKDDISFLKSGIETKNENFNRLIAQIERVAINTRDPLLLTGPTGAGKSKLAKRIYELKKSRNQISGEFVEINCATLRGDGAMSSLFGHKKGSFTGAVQDRAGLLRSADKGLLFLDEIGELGLDEQSMLLRAIEEKRFLPVGSDVEATSDFMLICGTNHDLSADVLVGKFRDDLLARINIWDFLLPGLKDRKEDIEPNINYELERFSEKNNKKVSFNKEAIEKFLKFSKSEDAQWLSNFRDLAASITRMSTLSQNGRITEEVVSEEIGRLKKKWQGVTQDSNTSDELTDLLSEEILAELDRFDRVQLEDVIRVCRQSKTLSSAGRVLFASSRKVKQKSNDADRLRKYLATFDLTFEDINTI